MLKNSKKILNTNTKSILPDNSVLFKKYKFSKLYKTKNYLFNYIFLASIVCKMPLPEIFSQINNTYRDNL